MNFEIRIAEKSDHQKLTEIAFAAKRHWGYPDEWVEGWNDDLTISPSYIDSHYVFKILDKDSDEICGFSGWELHRQAGELEIAHFWILPRYIGHRLGRALFDFAFGNLSSLPVRKLTVCADPNASGFYERLGFVQVKQIESTPPGRFLPVLEMEIN